MKTKIYITLLSIAISSLVFSSCNSSSKHHPVLVQDTDGNIIGDYKNVEKIDYIKRIINLDDGKKIKVRDEDAIIIDYPILSK
jgi:hypothetical protein